MIDSRRAHPGSRGHADQHFTEPPPRFSEASLVKELERLGIGRPSTYASIISTLVDRRYAQLEQRRFFPTPLGESVEKVMVKQFPDVFNVGFTSEMEGELDKIEEGQRSWQRVLKDFYGPFAVSLGKVDVGPPHRGSARSVGARERAVSRLRRQARRQGRVLRTVPGLREPSEEVQTHAAAGPRPEAGGADRTTCATSAARRC